MWDHTGRRRWSLASKLQDHVDAVAVGNFSADPKAAPRVYWSSSDEAFLMLDLQGNILKHTLVGHTQTAAVGKFRDDVPGLQYATTNFWRNPGIMSQPAPRGRLYAPVRNPHYNDSNYRAHVSLPRWVDAPAR
jgi:hypothetical protein